jgi:2-haloacid dehalogenase
MLQLDNFEVLTFDCFGTLIDWETGLLAALKPALSGAGGRLSDEDILSLYAEIEPAIQSGRYLTYQEVLQRAAEELGERAGLAPGQIDRDRILHVAQSVYHDIVPARSMGLATVWVNRRLGRPGSGATPPAEGKPDLEVPDLVTLAKLAVGH